nr:MAG TPA: Papain fold toxin 1, glutamine deamidase [Caudoviricetes sp.]
MPTRITIATYDEKHKQNLAKRAKKVSSLYDAAVKRLTQAAAPSLFDADKEQEFHFEDFPALKREMDALMQDLYSSLQTNIEDGDEESWTLSNTKNDAMVESVIGKAKLPKQTVQAWKHPHLEALNAFIDRKEAGMGLSKRVWNLTQQFKDEMELALELGMGEGKSAAELSRDIRKYLKEPNKLFRRVRDKSGALRLSKAAAAYHPGRGVYRSSYKNALRMTATENNMAYRTADHTRWQALPFVIGIEIHISNNHPTEDICDLFDGKRFPKDFKFTGWHPWCRCYAVSILAKQEEMDAYIKTLIAGEDVSDWQFTGKVEQMPTEFTKWMKDNESRIAKAKSMPYFIKDNFKDGDPAKGLRWEGVEKSFKKDGTIAATPKSKPADEWKGISKNDRELLELVQTEGWTEQNQDHYRDLLDKAYDAEMKKANLKPTKLRTKAEEDAVDSFRQWGFEELNEALRAGKSLNAKQREVQEQIDKIMSRTTLKKDMVVYRGTQHAPTDINPAYSSTTTRITIAEHFSSEMYGSKHLYAYRIPKGTHCLIIGGAEDEIVLPRGFNLGQYKIGAKKNEPAIIKKPTAKEIAAKRHAARTKEQVADIQDAWTERKLDIYDEKCDKLMKALTYSQGQALPALAKRQIALRNAIGMNASVEKVEALFAKFEKGVKAQNEWDTQVWGSFTKEQIANMRDIEKSLGIKKGRPMTYEEADKQSANPLHVNEYIVDKNSKWVLSGTKIHVSKNPLYNKAKHEPYDINCQTCAPAYALREWGFNIHAKGNTQKIGDLSYYLSHGDNWLETWTEKDGSPVSITSFKDFQRAHPGWKHMTQQRYLQYFDDVCKEEGTYEVGLSWEPRGGHCTIVKRFSDGSLKYIEPQEDNSDGSGFEEKDIKYLCEKMRKDPILKDGAIKISDKLLNLKYVSIFLKR